MGDLLAITDVFVLTHGSSTRQVRTIVDEIRRRMSHEVGEAPRRTEGTEDRSWVLLDYGDVVVHVFLAETREHFGLERLWADAPVIDWQPETEADQAAVS